MPTDLSKCVKHTPRLGAGTKAMGVQAAEGWPKALSGISSSCARWEGSSVLSDGYFRLKGHGPNILSLPFETC